MAAACQGDTGSAWMFARRAGSPMLGADAEHSINPMTLLTGTAEVAELCEALSRDRFVSVDTEFMRDRTYWPKLCLVQIAGVGRHAAIDPLAPGTDLEPLFALMGNPGVIKVFHAARQDVEIFHHLSGQVPEPLFDTQLAAMVLGFGEEVSYETLVTQVAKARVDKTSRFTDWSRRPLSRQQLDYAIADVTHLRVIYERLSEQLEQSGRAHWLSQELSGLTNPATYEQPPELAWKRIKVRSRDPRFLAVVRSLAAWREREAQRRDLPRNRVMRDDILLEVAANQPTTVEDMAKLRRVSLDRSTARSAVEAIGAALALPASELPRVEPLAKLPRGIGPLVDLLRVLLKFKSEEHHVAQRLVATTDDLEQIAAFDAPDVPSLKGWRREVFGDAALALKRGEIALAVQRGRIQIVATDKLEATA
jgi:ribonuclease D